MIKLSFRLSSELPNDTNSIISSLPFGDAETSRLRAVKNEQSRALSLCALLALWDILDEPDIPTVLRSENRKPYFEDSSLFFSLSHVDKLATAVLSDAPIGIDIEWLDASRKAQAISSRFFSNEEQTEISNSSDPLESFFSMWTKKEAYAKLTGKGLASICAGELPVELCFSQYRLDLCGKKGILSICHQNSEKILIINPYNKLKITELN